MWLPCAVLAIEPPSCPNCALGRTNAGNTGFFVVHAPFRQVLSLGQEVSGGLSPSSGRRPDFTLRLPAMKARIRALLQATPFQPFVIRMADGREYRVEHPDFVLASSTEVPQVIIEEPDGQTHFLSVLLMTSIGQAPVATAAA